MAEVKVVYEARRRRWCKDDWSLRWKEVNKEASSYQRWKNQLDEEKIDPKQKR